MSVGPGPRGCTLVCEPSDEVPLVWLRVAIRGGAAGDPPGIDGFTRHALELARRGAGSRDRAALDEAVDDLGASLAVSTARDYTTVSGLCLARNTDHLVALMSDVLARPRFDRDEHDKLLRETRFTLDEVRDDDSSLAARFFNRDCAPGHPYGRSILGTGDSLDRVELAGVRDAYRRAVVPENLVVGVAGAVTEETAERIAARLVADLPGGPPPPLPDVDRPGESPGQRLLIVDKPDRAQTQVLIGHAGPRYGSEPSLAFWIVETILGGTFSSRLNQEIRANRGWSYGAGCTLQRARGPHFFRVWLAPAAEVTPEAIALAKKLVTDVTGATELTDDEVDFAKSYLVGSIAMNCATARQRMRIAVRNAAYGLPASWTETLPERIESVTPAAARDAARTWLVPNDALTCLVATADEMLGRVDGLGLGPATVVPYDSY